MDVYGAEGAMGRGRVPIIDRDACTSCGLCVTLCPEHVVDIAAQVVVFVNPGACTYCGLCEETCPVGAIALPYAIVWDAGISIIP